MPQTPAPQTDKSYTKHIVMALGALVVAIILVVLVVNHNKSKPTFPAASADVTPPVAVVQITSKGFVPSTLNVKAGTVVEWVSSDTVTTHIVAANPYPKHTDLPGLVSGQLGNGAKYRFTFKDIGEFGYHDDLNPTVNAKIIVTR